MTTARAKTVTRLLSGTTFAAVLAAAGCAGSPSKPSTALYTAPDPAVADAPAVPVNQEPTVSSPGFDVSAIAPTPKVNIFGEFGGEQRTPTRIGGGAGYQQHTFVDDGFDGDVSVDPKGEHLAFSSTRHSEHADIYIQRVDGVSVTQLTSDEADDAFPSFSPDGQKIAFCSTRSGNWDIYVMDVDGKNAVQLTSGPMQEIHPSFSPDGTRLVYSAQSTRSGQWELWTVDLGSSERKMIGYGLFPAWSPRKDKDQIAFQKARARGSRWFSLWTLDLIDGEAKAVTEVAVSSNAAIVSPSWNPNGMKLSFSTIVEPTKSDDGKPAGQQDVWTVNVDGTNRRRITDGNGTSATPFWAANNRIYFVSNRAGTDSIWSAQAEIGSNSATVKTETQELAN